MVEPTDVMEELGAQCGPGSPGGPGKGSHTYAFAERRNAWGFAIFLAVAMAGAYYGALYHIHRGDQWWFLVDMKDHHGLWDTFRACYSYPRMRVVTKPIDTDIFRPLFFFFLSLQSVLFKERTMPWQAVAIGLHYINCLLMLALMFESRRLWRARKPREAPAPRAVRFLPYVLVLFFAFNPRILESVIWAHVNGYLLFNALISLAMIQTLRLARGPATRRWPWGGIAGIYSICFASAFLYELGQFFAVVIGILASILIAQKGPGRRFVTFLAITALFLTIPLTYQGVNRIDRAVHKSAIERDPLRNKIAATLDPKLTARNAIRAMSDFVVRPFFPFHFPARFAASMLVVPETPFAELVAHGPEGAASSIIVLTCILAGGWGLWRVVRLRDPAILGYAVAIALMGGLYVAAVVLGRLNGYDPGDRLLPGVVSHYAYVPLWSFLLVLFLAIGSPLWVRTPPSTGANASCRAG